MDRGMSKKKNWWFREDDKPNDPRNVEFDVKNMTCVSVLELSNKFP